MISIASMRGGNYPSRPWQVRVDRAGVLGNPYGMRRLSERDVSCDKYHLHFHRMVREHDKEFMDEIARIIGIYKVHGKLELMCWCTPLRCHSETIKDYLEATINGG